MSDTVRVALAQVDLIVGDVAGNTAKIIDWACRARDEDDAEADNYLVERKFFRLSLYYLFAHFGAILLEAALKPWGLGGWS